MNKSLTRNCGGKLITSVVLKSAITNKIISVLNNVGFITNQRLLKYGLLSLEKEDIRISIIEEQMLHSNTLFPLR